MQVESRRGGKQGSGQLQELLQSVLLHSFHEELVILQGNATGSLTRQEGP